MDRTQEKLRETTRRWQEWKDSASVGRSLQNAGMSVPMTKMRDMQNTVNSLSRQVMNAMEFTTIDELESLGELFLNAAQNLKAARQDPNYIW